MVDIGYVGKMQLAPAAACTRTICGANYRIALLRMAYGGDLGEFNVT